jgi:hypothetical protein
VFHNFIPFLVFCLGKQWANSIRRARTVKPVFKNNLAPTVPWAFSAGNRVNRALARGFRAPFSRVSREPHAGVFAAKNSSLRLKNSEIFRAP